jgi:hypothetical protein
MLILEFRNEQDEQDFIELWSRSPLNPIRVENIYGGQGFLLKSVKEYPKEDEE